VPIRYDDDARTLALSVRDLLEEGAPSGHLTLEVAQTRQARLAAGRAVHTDHQGEQAGLDAAYRAEVRLKHNIAIRDWTVVLHGRVDGLTEEDGRSVVEEIKSTAFDAASLQKTTLADWAGYVSQLEVYLWMLHEARYDRPIGRLVLVSLSDGSKHVLGVPLDAERIGRFVRDRLVDIARERERRIAWMQWRRTAKVPLPHPDWRQGQREISEAVLWGLQIGHQVLIEAPTGLGKTAAILHGALQFAFSRDLQVFWATSRTTQQDGVDRTLRRFAEAGLPLRTIRINAKEKMCLNAVVACRPDACRHAFRYYDKMREKDLPHALIGSPLGRSELMAAGAEHEVCPFELSLDASYHADVLVGDYNYVFDPGVYLRRHFGEDSGRWLVVVDEAHQLVDRAREYGSPRISAADANRAAEILWEDAKYAPFAELCEEIAALVERTARGAPGPKREGLAVAEIPRAELQRLADRIDDVAMDYALLKAQRPIAGVGERDPWLDVGRGLLRLVASVESAGPETIALASDAEGQEWFGLLCLDPSAWLGPRLARLGGFVACSATLTPSAFYRDLLGLPKDRTDVVQVPSPFPPENRRVLVAPRVSTAYRDRVSHAAPTADLLAKCIEAIPGNVAVYFPSFAMLRDLTGRWNLPGHELLAQEPTMPDARRKEWLDRLAAPGRPAVLAAVLGGIFAEGIDLPPGALSGVLVVGPALPPVGLERDLLQQHYEERYGQGFRYASLVPGMTRVVQAAGRLIRRLEDRGVVVLLDRRFRWREYQELLPADWVVEVPDDPATEIRAFFQDS
jgi:DNA excision repair protein ERCC-2